MVNGMATLYDVLEVKEDATVDEIRAGFRKYARRFHPDFNQDPRAAEALRIITHAYETLSDPDKRRGYDAELAALRAPKPRSMVIQIGGQGFSGFSGTTTNTAATSGAGGVWFTVY